MGSLLPNLRLRTSFKDRIFFLTNTLLLSSQDMMDWSGAGYSWIIVMFLSAVWTIHLWANVHFWVNYSLNYMLICVRRS